MKTVKVTLSIMPLAVLCGCTCTPATEDSMPLTAIVQPDVGTCGKICSCKEQKTEPEQPPLSPNFWGDYRCAEFPKWSLVLDESENSGKLSRGERNAEEIIEFGVVFLSPHSDAKSCFIDMRIPEYENYKKRFLKIREMENGFFEVILDVGSSNETSLGKTFKRRTD